MSEDFQNRSLFTTGYFVKIAIESIYENLFKDLEQELYHISDSYHKLDFQNLVDEYGRIQIIESSLPLPIQIRQQLIESKNSINENNIYTESFENERKCLLETIDVIKKRLVLRMFEISPDAQTVLMSMIEKREAEKESNKVDKLNIVKKVDPPMGAGIFMQIEDKRLFDYLVNSYQGCTCKDIVPMLYAVTDLGLLKKNVVFGSQVKLYKELQDLFHCPDTRQNLNKSISTHNRPTRTHTKAIKHHKKMLYDFSNSLNIRNL